MTYRKKPVEVEAWKYDSFLTGDVPSWVYEAVDEDVIYYRGTITGWN